MDNLIKQMRVRFYGDGQDNKELQISSRDRRFAPQKSLSFKEKRTGQSWLRRQFSRQMSRGYGSDNEIDHVTAVAAAVFAVHSIEESEITSRKDDFKAPRVTAPNLAPQPRKVTSKRLAEIASQKDDFKEPRVTAPKPRKVEFKRFADEDFLKETESSDGKVAVSSKQEKEKPKEAIASPSLKKTPTFSGEKPDSSGGKKPETAAAKPPLPPPTPHPSAVKNPPNEPTEIIKPVPTRPSERESKAEAWEKAEMAKIREKYEKVHETISYWENKKREKAIRKLETAQGVGVDHRKRERAQKKYAEDIEFIKQIAGEARAKAEERRRKDVLKAKQKADTLRKTGELPLTCFCC